MGKSNDKPKINTLKEEVKKLAEYKRIADKIHRTFSNSLFEQFSK